MAVSSFKGSINGASDRATSIWELTPCLFVWLVQCVGSTISRWLAATAYSSVITAGSITVCTIASSKVADVHGCIHGIYVGKITWTSLDRSLSIMINVHSGIHVLVVSITLDWHTVFMLDGIACPTVLSLLSKLGLGNCLELVVTIGWILAWGVHAWYHLIVVRCWVEELLCCHHHLLLVVLVSIGCFPLIHQIEQMGLIILGNTVSCTDSVASNPCWVDAERAGSISVTGVGNVLMVHLFEWLSSMMLLSLEIIHILLSSVALSDVFHEVAIVHGVSHLCLILTTFAWVLRCTETTDSGLIEHLLLCIDLSVNMR